MLNKILKKTFFLLVITASLSFSQELFVCESYTEDGKPVGPINRMEIKPYGSAVYVLLDYGKELKDPILYLFVDKLIDGKFTPFESKTISIKKTDTWAVTSFEFRDTGIYELYFLNSSQSRLASNKFETIFSENSATPIITPNMSSSYRCKFTFCELVINGKPINPFTKISLSQSGGKVFIYLKNPVPFGTESIKVQIWKRSKTNSNYEELIDSKKYRILPEWSDTFFQYTFVNTGEYKIDIFDKVDNFLTSNVITITN